MANISIFDVKETLDALIHFIRSDYKTNGEVKSWLRRVITHEGQYKKAKSIFLKGSEYKDNIKTTYEFPNNENAFPCIVLRCPGSGIGDSNTLGIQETVKFLGTDIKTDYDVYKNSEVLSYDFICCGKNYEESYIISEILKALFVAAKDTFIVYLNTEKIAVKTKDIYMESNLTPRGFFKITTLEVQIPQFIPTIETNTFITNYNFITKVVEK